TQGTCARVRRPVPTDHVQNRRGRFPDRFLRLCLPGQDIVSQWSRLLRSCRRLEGYRVGLPVLLSVVQPVSAPRTFANASNEGAQGISELPQLLKRDFS